MDVCILEKYMEYNTKRKLLIFCEVEKRASLFLFNSQIIIFLLLDSGNLPISNGSIIVM